ncbi:aspartate ammonia-lyase [Candidatus Roizmanbacteria bacterium]|nr:aspartate ammonia-lyase [Candidatus Roizmanbacteria bacterium]
MSNKILYGPQTKASLENFPFDYHKVLKEFVYAMIMIKKAAAVANFKAGKVNKKLSDKIVAACDEILKGKYDDQFVVSAHHGGAGTSVNMNVNEVIGTLAGVHPNDHVNSSQSTNDVNPSALKIASIKLTEKLLKSLDYLISVFDEKAKEYRDVRKLARTHIQDAVPTTLGAEFGSYRDILIRDKKRIEDSLSYFYELNIGGTAIGNKINAPEIYIKEFYKEIRQVAGINKLVSADNLMSQTSSDTDFCFLSTTINILCLDISKMSIDFRFMASGPKGGIGEISFKELQPGSSIMPGKVNPIVAETMNQTYYLVSGKNLSIHQAAEASQLELGVMLPIIADSLITILKVVDTALKLFADRGIKNIVVNRERCLEHLEKSTAYSTLLTPRLGYDAVSKVVKESVATGRTMREIILEKKLLKKEELDKILSIL